MTGLQILKLGIYGNVIENKSESRFGRAYAKEASTEENTRSTWGRNSSMPDWFTTI